MGVVHDKIRLAISDRGMTMPQAAKACDLKYTTLRTCLVDERDIPFSTLSAISNGLSLDFAYFSDAVPAISLEDFRSRDRAVAEAMRGIKAELEKTARGILYKGDAISLQSFLDWWVTNCGRLENFDRIAERVDVFEVPSKESNQIIPTKVGRESLATKHFRLEETQHLNQTLDGFSTPCNKQLVAAHLEAFSRGEPVISHPEIDEKLRDGTPFKRRYRRVLAPVKRSNGKMVLLNYSEDVKAD